MQRTGYKEGYGEMQHVADMQHVAHMQHHVAHMLLHMPKLHLFAISQASSARRLGIACLFQVIKRVQVNYEILHPAAT